MEPLSQGKKRIPLGRLIFYVYVYAISGTVLFVLLSNNQNWLESASQAVTIITATVAFFVIISFSYERKHEQTLSVVSQLDFFRTIILDYINKLKKKVEEKDPKYNQKDHRVGALEEFSYAWARVNYKDKLDAQDKLTRDFNLGGDVIGLFNALEQFSWSVILNDTANHPALEVVMGTYVRTVESYLHDPLLSRALNGKTYEGIKTMYILWAPKVSRESLEEVGKRVAEEVKKIKPKKSEN